MLLCSSFTHRLFFAAFVHRLSQEHVMCRSQFLTAFAHRRQQQKGAIRGRSTTGFVQPEFSQPSVVRFEYRSLPSPSGTTVCCFSRTSLTSNVARPALCCPFARAVFSALSEWAAVHAFRGFGCLCVGRVGVASHVTGTRPCSCASYWVVVLCCPSRQQGLGGSEVTEVVVRFGLGERCGT